MEREIVKKRWSSLSASCNEVSDDPARTSDVSPDRAVSGLAGESERYEAIVQCDGVDPESGPGLTLLAAVRCVHRESRGT